MADFCVDLALARGGDFMVGASFGVAKQIPRHIFYDAVHCFVSRLHGTFRCHHVRAFLAHLYLLFSLHRFDAHRRTFPALLLAGDDRRGSLFSVNLFTLEYYFGIELLRPLLLWVVVSEITPERRSQIKRTLLAYLPYAIVLLCFILWRIFGFHSQDYGIALGANSGFLQTFRRMLLQVPGAIWTSSVGAWLEIFRFPSTIDFGIFLSVVYTLVLLGSFAALIFYVSRLKSLENQADSPGSDKKSSDNGSSLARCALLTAGIPFYIVGIEVRLDFPADRFTQPFAFGAAFILAGLLELIPSFSWRTNSRRGAGRIGDWITNPIWVFLSRRLEIAGSLFLATLLARAVHPTRHGGSLRQYHFPIYR